jgi:sulfotransferase
VLKIHFISGLPGSGSTLLAAILRQNPAFHASISGPVADLVGNLVRSMGFGEFAMFRTDAQRQRILRAVVESYYADLPESRIIFDTNRSWCNMLPALAGLFPAARVICMLRSPAWILDSIERLVQNNPYQASKMFGQDGWQNVYTRVDAVFKGSFLGQSLNGLRQAWFGEHASRLIGVRYDSLAEHPSQVIARLYELLGESPFEHDFEQVEFEAPEFDARLNMPGLHKVTARVEPKKREQATKYLPFGEEKTATAQDRDKFGKYLRDSVSGLDYAEQRYYSSTIGRFTAPDPYQRSIRADVPDSWNRFAFVGGDPANRADPHGGYYGAYDDPCGGNGGVGGGGGSGYGGPYTTTVSATQDPVPYYQAPIPNGYSNRIPVYGPDAADQNPTVYASYTFPNGLGYNADVPLDPSLQAALSGVDPSQIYGMLGLVGGGSVLAGAGVAAGLALAGAAVAGSVFVGETPVLGGLTFTGGYSGVAGYTIYSVTNYNWPGNLAWLQSQMATGQSIVVGPGGLFTNLEQGELTSAGYIDMGGTIWIPPVP